MTDRADLERLLELRHHDPHSLLGAHPVAGGVVVRAFRPRARRVTVRTKDGSNGRRAMERVHPAGLFETTLPAPAAPDYRLEVELADGRTTVEHDPYRFAPTLGELDLHLFGEGRHERLWDVMGAHPREVDAVSGVSFAVWAPSARGVSVVGDWNGWDGRVHAMRSLGASGVWELFLPGVEPGARYKFEIRPAGDGPPLLKADPFAFATELPPRTASVVHRPSPVFSDEGWLAARAEADAWRAPMSIYEVHLGSWRRTATGEPLGYREVAPLLADHAARLGFTHVELLPVMEHPFGGSWGYQVTGYFAPTARFGEPDDLRFLIDHLHRRGIGVILDWVPAHFPRDAHGLARFDGTPLYEHGDPREGEHPDWGTLVFNFGRHEVKNFLIASALYWLEELHADGLRLDAVASMLYRDYSRSHGEWIPNRFGGRENLEAIDLLRELTDTVHRRCPGALVIAEESTAFAGVSRPTVAGGLGFDAKWNMGWMHDTLVYFGKDPVHRRYHHNELTFSLHYAWSERFLLPLSHDEVVHGKGSLLAKMPGDRWQRFANLRALLAHMWAHPGKQLLFMGGEIGQEGEWRHDHSLDWHLLDDPFHRGVQELVAELNRIYRAEPALWEVDEAPAGFEWIDGGNADQNVICYLRMAPTAGSTVAVVANLAPVVHHGYRVGLPAPGRWVELLDTDAERFGGSNVGNGGAVEADAVAMHGRPFSAAMTLPPLGVLWLAAPPADVAATES